MDEHQVIDVLLEEFEIDEDELGRAVGENPFLHAAFELLKETSATLAAIAGLRRPEQADGLERNQAIVVGHFAHVIKLSRSLIRQIVDEHGGDQQISVGRQVLESIATVVYLLGDLGDGSRYDAYVLDSLIAEKEFLREVSAQIEQRGYELPIEARIKRSIQNTLDAAGVSEQDIPARRKNAWPSAKDRIEALGPTMYVAYRTGSGPIHGAFSDLEKRHLEQIGDKFEIQLEPALFRPQPLIAIGTLSLIAARRYLTVHYPDVASGFEPALLSQEKRLKRVDELHEELLVRSARERQSDGE